MLHPSVHPAGSRHEVAGYGATRPPLPTAGYKVTSRNSSTASSSYSSPSSPGNDPVPRHHNIQSFADGSQQTVTLTSLMLATAFFGNFTRFRYLADLPRVPASAVIFIPEITGYGSNNAKHDNTNDNVPHVNFQLKQILLCASLPNRQDNSLSPLPDQPL